MHDQTKIWTKIHVHLSIIPLWSWLNILMNWHTIYILHSLVLDICYVTLFTLHRWKFTSLIYMNKKKFHKSSSFKKHFSQLTSMYMYMYYKLYFCTDLLKKINIKSLYKYWSHRLILNKRVQVGYFYMLNPFV